MNENLHHKLHFWLMQEHLPCMSNKLKHQFSDGVLLAQLLHRHYPQLVIMHQYAPCSSVQRKLINWNLLNRQVLQRLGMPRTKADLLSLAQGSITVIKQLLYDLMLLVEKKDGNEESHAYLKLSGVAVDITQRDEDKLQQQAALKQTCKRSNSVGLCKYKLPSALPEIKSYEVILERMNKPRLKRNAEKEQLSDLLVLDQLKNERVEDLCMQLTQLRAKCLSRKPLPKRIEVV